MRILPVLDLPHSEEVSPPSLSLEHMHDYVLLEIISQLPVATGEGNFSSKNGVKQAIGSFNALGKVNRNLNRLIKEDYTRGVFVKALIKRYGSLGKLGKNGGLDNGLNLDLKALELGFGLYFKDLDNKFSKLTSLDRQIKELATTISNRANVVFKRANALPPITCKVKSFEKRALPYSATGYQSGLGDFCLRVNLKGISIITPLHSIEIEEVSSEEPNQMAVLAISEALINSLGATLKSAGIPDADKTYYELSRPTLFGQHQQVRKIETEELIRLEGMEGVNKAKGTQRLIVPEKGSSFYSIRKIGKWEGYVLEIAHSICQKKGALFSSPTEKKLSLFLQKGVAI